MVHTYLFENRQQITFLNEQMNIYAFDELYALIFYTVYQVPVPVDLFS